MTNPSPSENTQFDLDKPYTLAELLAKDKAELEKMKLVAELISQKKKNTTDLVRAIMIPVLVAFLTWLSTSIITKSNQKEAALGNDKKYIRDIDMEIRRTTDIETHRLWIQRLQVFRANNKECKDAEILSILDENKMLLAADSVRRVQDSISVMAQKKLSPSDTMLLAQIEEKEKQAQNAKILLQETSDVVKQEELKGNIRKFNNDITKLLKTSPTLTNTFDKTDSLGIRTQTQIREVEPVAAENVESTPIYWFKEGNFLICFDELKVLLYSIDPVSKTIKFSAFYFDKANPQSNEKVIAKELTVSLGSTIKLNEKYTLKLVSIDHAGRNPFTLAAYVTCSKNTATAVGR